MDETTMFSGWTSPHSLQNNPLLEATFPQGNDLSESLQVARKRARHYEEIDEQEVGKVSLWNLWEVERNYL